jgi:hypothetical protein
LPKSHSQLAFVQQDLRIGENEIQTKVKKLKEQKFPMMQRYQKAAKDSFKTQEASVHNQ